jgi:phosphohistidine phosphatase
MSDRHRTLMLLRHGKAEDPGEIADHDRALTARGIREAGMTGSWMRTHVPAVDVVLCSTATRTRQTLEHTGIEATTRYTEHLYDTTVGTVIAEINAVATGAGTVLVVGHEPTMSQLATGLAGEGTDDAVAGQISTKFPTSAVAVLRVACPWDQLQPGAAALVDLHVPR